VHQHPVVGFARKALVVGVVPADALLQLIAGGAHVVLVELGRV